MPAASVPALAASRDRCSDRCAQLRCGASDRVARAHQTTSAMAQLRPLPMPMSATRSPFGMRPARRPWRARWDRRGAHVAELGKDRVDAIGGEAEALASLSVCCRLTWWIATSSSTSGDQPSSFGASSKVRWASSRPACEQLVAVRDHAVVLAAAEVAVLGRREAHAARSGAPLGHASGAPAPSPLRPSRASASRSDRRTRARRPVALRRSMVLSTTKRLLSPSTTRP
jgi:hypothetical protein